MRRCTSTSLSEPNRGESETLSAHHQQPLLLEYSLFLVQDLFGPKLPDFLAVILLLIIQHLLTVVLKYC